MNFIKDFPFSKLEDVNDAVISEMIMKHKIFHPFQPKSLFRLSIEKHLSTFSKNELLNVYSEIKKEIENRQMIWCDYFNRKQNDLVIVNNPKVGYILCIPYKELYIKKDIHFYLFNSNFEMENSHKQRSISYSNSKNLILALEILHFIPDRLLREIEYFCDNFPNSILNQFDKIVNEYRYL